MQCDNILIKYGNLMKDIYVNGKLKEYNCVNNK